MEWKTTVFATLLFVLLMPKILFTFPRKGSKWTIALVHAAIFAFIFHILSKLLFSYFSVYEGNEGTYKKDPETDNPNGPPTVDSCNYANVGKRDKRGQQCFKDTDKKLYFFDNTCSSENDVGKTNRFGAVCSGQTDNKGGIIYNFVSK
jgi:hypothetical protein